MLIYRGSFRYSPRVWRWSYALTQHISKSQVFSTCVEVILVSNCVIDMYNCILHVCGGDPTTRTYFVASSWYSPRVWRWSHTIYVIILISHVFSTCVEVILCVCHALSSALGILHVCGGDPLVIRSQWSVWMYSPRVWRWSYIIMYCRNTTGVFSTCVEVILLIKLKCWFNRSILHVCGGDPVDGNICLIDLKYYPRVWRWS